MIYIVTTEQFPNGLAATQRIKCYAKGLVELGQECSVLCLNRCEDPHNPSGNSSTSGIIDGYTYQYMGASTALDTGKIKVAIHKTTDILKFIICAVSTFNSSDKVVLYSYNTILIRLILLLSSIKGFETYYELNEHPSIQFRGFEMDEDKEKDLRKLFKLLHGFDGILCISTALKQLLTKCGIADNKVHIVNMLVDSSRFDGIEKQGLEHYIGYCGAADNNKDGVDKLIRAFKIIESKYPTTKLYIMGPKREDCNNEELAKELSISEKVVFTGMINSTDLPQMLKNAEVLALARPQSRQAQYGFPTKLGEYLSTSNPVVVTAVGDIPYFLKDGESAYLAEPDDIEEFASKLDLALSQKELAVQIGEKGREIALNSFSKEAVIQQLKVAMNL